MRILVADVNFDYKNPIYRQFYTSLFSCMEVDFFGPGYVPRDCLEKGICAFMNKNDRYDAILLGNYFVYAAGEKGTRHNAYHTHRHTLPYYKVNDAYQCCGKIYEELKGIRDVIKIFFYYEDNCSMPLGDKAVCEQLIDCGFYILSFPIEYMERYTGKIRHIYPYLTNNAYELAENYSTQYIPVSILGIGYHEIFVRNFFDRDYEWCVPGNRAEWFYPERNKAQKIIEQGQKKLWNDDPFQLLSVETVRRENMEWYCFHNRFEKILSWVWGKNDNIASRPKMQYIAACREQYLESMRSSKFVYAEGGAGNQMVRKYLESCACGAVLVAKRVPGMDEAGFVHGENCIIVDKYEDIARVDALYTESQMKQIAINGQRMIIDKHMFAHRADALKRTIWAIMQGRYKGAYWEGGSYVIKE